MITRSNCIKCDKFTEVFGPEHGGHRGLCEKHYEEAIFNPEKTSDMIAERKRHSWNDNNMIFGSDEEANAFNFKKNFESGLKF